MWQKVAKFKGAEYFCKALYLVQGQNDKFLPCQLGDSIQQPFGYWPNALTTRGRDRFYNISNMADTSQHSYSY